VLGDVSTNSAPTKMAGVLAERLQALHIFDTYFTFFFLSKTPRQSDNLD